MPHYIFGEGLLHDVMFLGEGLLHDVMFLGGGTLT